MEGTTNQEIEYTFIYKIHLKIASNLPSKVIQLLVYSVYNLRVARSITRQPLIDCSDYKRWVLYRIYSVYFYLCSYTWLAREAVYLPVMAPQSLKRTIQQYRSLMTQLEAQQTKLIQQSKQADLHAYVIVDSDSSVEQSSYHTEANSLLLASIEKQLGITILHCIAKFIV